MVREVKEGKEARVERGVKRRGKEQETQLLRVVLMLPDSTNTPKYRPIWADIAQNNDKYKIAERS